MSCGRGLDQTRPSPVLVYFQKQPKDFEEVEPDGDMFGFVSDGTVKLILEEEQMGSSWKVFYNSLGERLWPLRTKIVEVELLRVEGSRRGEVGRIQGSICVGGVQNHNSSLSALGKDFLGRW